MPAQWVGRWPQFRGAVAGLEGRDAVQRDIEKPPGIGQSQIRGHEDVKYKPTGEDLECGDWPAAFSYLEEGNGEDWAKLYPEAQSARVGGSGCKQLVIWGEIATGYTGKRKFPVRVMCSTGAGARGGCSISSLEPQQHEHTSQQPGARLCFQREVGQDDPKGPSQPKLFYLIRRWCPPKIHARKLYMLLSDLLLLIVN